LGRTCQRRYKTSRENSGSAVNAVRGVFYCERRLALNALKKERPAGEKRKATKKKGLLTVRDLTTRKLKAEASTRATAAGSTSAPVVRFKGETLKKVPTRVLRGLTREKNELARSWGQISC